MNPAVAAAAAAAAATYYRNRLPESLDMLSRDLSSSSSSFVLVLSKRRSAFAMVNWVGDSIHYLLNFQERPNPEGIECHAMKHIFDHIYIYIILRLLR